MHSYCVVRCCPMLAIVKRRSRFLLFVLIPFGLFALRYLTACEALPFLSAAAPVVASVASAGFQYASAAEQARAKGADAATVEALGRLEKTVATNDAKLLAACKAKPASTARPLAAKVAADAAQDAELAALRSENSALKSQIAAVLARLDAPRSSPPIAGDAGTEGGSQ